MLLQSIGDLSPIQSSCDLLHNVEDTDDTVNYSLKKSIQYHVSQELLWISAFLLEDVEVDDNLGLGKLIISHPLKQERGRAITVSTCKGYPGTQDIGGGNRISEG